MPRQLTTKPSKTVKPSTVRLQVGDKAPDFNLASADGRSVALGDLLDRTVILYFYPAALTPGCTKEACDFRDMNAKLNKAGYVVIGVSPDSIDTLNHFKTQERLNFPLLSDPDLKTHVKYGTWAEKSMYGRTSVGVVRSTFVIGTDGRITHAMYGHKATGHVQRLLKLLELR
jgi:peroxiredoxin Q/BCP